MQLFLKIAGGILLVLGLLLAFKPQLVEGGLPSDSYQLIEKRVKWGFVIGLGIFLFFHRQWSSWQLSVTALLMAFTLGILLARSLGMALDGIFSKQLLWLSIEVAAFGLFTFIYFKLKP